MQGGQFHIQVDGLTRREYLQAGSQLIWSILPTGLLMVTLITGCILLLMDTVTVTAVAVPYLVLGLAVLLGLGYLRLDWKKAPKDVSFSFSLDGEGWEMAVGGQRGGAAWSETSRMKERSAVLLFYQRGKSSSSALPRRCLTPEQLEAVRGWYAASREDFKRKDKELWKQERAAAQASRQTRGPFWKRR